MLSFTFVEKGREFESLTLIIICVNCLEDTDVVPLRYYNHVHCINGKN